MANNANNYFKWRQAFIADDRLSATTRLVMHAIHVYMDDKSLEAFPSRSRLARDTGLSVKSVSKHTEAATKLGWLKKIKAKQPGNQFLNNIYKGIIPTQGRLYTPKREPDDVPRLSNGPRLGNEGNTNYPENYLYNSSIEESIDTHHDNFDSNERKKTFMDVGGDIVVRESQVKTKEDFYRTLSSFKNAYSSEKYIDWVFENNLSEVKTREELPPKTKVL